jgi:Calcineurin-like phosphoesterase
MSRSLSWLLQAGLLLGAPACARDLLPPGPVMAAADSSQIETSVYLIGDGGDPAATGEPVLAALSRAIARDPARSLVLILGDNVYLNGIDTLETSSHRHEQEWRLTTQLDVLLHNRVRGIVVPGNHDWARHKPSGWKSIKVQEEFVRKYVEGFERAQGWDTLPDSPTVAFLPTGGCPGPSVRDFGDHLRVLVLDTQWWLHPYVRPKSEKCGEEGDTRAVERIRSALASAGPRRTLVVAHHPIETAGEHDGYFDWKTHLFPFAALDRHFLIPLPVIGSLYPLARMHGVDAQDMSSPIYCRMLAVLDSGFRPIPPLLYAAGHDHGLQVFKGGHSRYEVVSGGGIYGHTNPFSRRPNSLLSLAASGFMRLDIMRDDTPPRLGVHVIDGAGEDHEVFALRLDDSAPAPASEPRACRELPRHPDVSLQVPGREN